MSLAARRIWSGYILLLALAAYPILSVDLPPLFDYPNHLARMHLLAVGGDRFVAVHWRLLPNLAEDLIVPPLAALMPLALAAKLFLILTLALLAAGPILLARVVTGAWQAWSLGAFLMLYSRTMLWGFLNYLFGLGIAFCGIALWLALEGSSWKRRLPLGWLVATLCYFCHVEAFGCYALMIVAIEGATFPRAPRWRTASIRLIGSMSQFAVPGLLFLGTHLGGAGAWHYANFGRKADLLFSVFDNYQRPFDIACFAGLVTLVILLAATRALRIDRRGAAALGVLFAAYLVLPSQLMSGSGADHRLPVALFLLLFAVTRPVRFAKPAGILLLALFVIRMGLIEGIWRAANEVHAADLALLDTLPEGARLAVAYPPSALNMTTIPETHIPTLAIIRREAFVPTLFAYKTQQPVEFRPAAAALAAAVSPDGLWDAFTVPGGVAPAGLDRFDYAVFLGPHAMSVRRDPCLEPSGGTATFRLFRIVAASCGTPSMH